MGRQEAGRVVGGKYEILTCIGTGGMSQVWLARDLRLGKLWAVKEIKPNASGEQERANRQAIVDEANFMKRLDHPAIPRIVDMFSQEGTEFVVMDYVEGRSLGAVLRERGALAQDEAVSIGIQLCDVLAYLHGRNPPVVYRDLKPANVMLRDDGSVRLVDFGIAEELLPGRGDDGRVIGTVGYSAPEQVDPRLHELHPTDTRADVYALGTTLFSLLTGVVPQRREAGDGAVAYDFALRPLREANPALSDGLERVIAQATRDNPGERYGSVVEMRYDLEHHVELTREHRERQQARLRRFRRRVVGAAAAAAMGVACLAAARMARDSSREALVHEAEAAGTAGSGEEGTGPSEAEALYGRAIEASPDTLETYEGLLAVYRLDQVLTPAESERWMRLWQTHGQRLAGDARYARLCYDVGVLYLCYYDGGSPKGTLGDSPAPATTGQGAVERIARSAEWFARARESCDPARGDYRGLVVDDSLDEYAATLAYERIAEFHASFVQAGQEGRDLTEPYRSFWQGLVEAVEGADGADPVSARAEPIVRLRLYQVASEALRSPTHLAGLRRAGVSEDEARALLSCVGERTSELVGFVEGNPAGADMYHEIAQGHAMAEDNIDRTYGSPVARMSGDAASGGGGEEA